MNEDALKQVYQVVLTEGKDVIVKIADIFAKNVEQENKTNKPITVFVFGTQDGAVGCQCMDELITMSDEDKVKTMNLFIDHLTMVSKMQEMLN